MLLALDIGNTEITAGLFHGDTLSAHWRLTTNPDRTPDEWAAAFGGFPSRPATRRTRSALLLLASVAPATTGSVTEGVEKATGTRPVPVDARARLPVVLDVEEPLSVGADRIVNVLAAAELHGGNLIVVDFGTATTFDCITADGRFIGGAIMPGLRTSADQLTRRAAKLPATELAAPDRVIGRRTDECIQAGVIFGTADAVDGIVRRIIREWPEPRPGRAPRTPDGAKPAVIATGGLAALVVPHCTTIERIERDLTLQGLRLAARHLGLTW